MRVLWLCNIILPSIARDLGEDIPCVGGWLTGTADVLLRNEDITLGVCFHYKERIKGVVSGITYYGFKDCQLSEMMSVIADYNPDVIHIWGTEFLHSKVMLEAVYSVRMAENTVVSIQGMISIISAHYSAGLPIVVLYGRTLRDIVKRDCIANQIKRWRKRGEFEIQTIKHAKHIIGRTDWDRACTQRINKKAKYHFCNEILRSVFYRKAGSWSLDKCEKHSIFISQSYYPVKGFHQMIKVLAELKRDYPDVKLYTTGKDPYIHSFDDLKHRSYYEKYLGKLIKRYGLEKHIVFLGSLNEEEISDRFLKSHVYVCTSSIENSPNSLGEAMMLGVPVVSSDVGGVKNMLEHNRDGFIYPYDEPYMCAYYIKKIFDNNDLDYSLSKNASEHAVKIYDRGLNGDRLYEIYEEIMNR